MTIPVTSTKVETKGAEETAGSKPAFDRINGNIEPQRFPQRTTHKRLNEMELAIWRKPTQEHQGI